ncbi:glycosyltransferase family 2 protein [Planobispora longispora]|uniref:Glycosyltransferase 2-like domain-containing protein n=1 Tax=Planobispora longispora TaxID=28887 RepID=A0A8J3RJU0_9ACTN|nr:glycosyltransferase family 2 protein [Planobispora longispora]GIH76215.1 hypothetical protein Plo01_26440 [Planobispora longispora]
MRHTDALVSVGLPVYNGADRMEGVVRSILAQDHENLELVISDNASTDHTEELCRELARQDSRIVYHRQRENIGATNNFIYVGEVANGAFLRWAGDDDRLEPSCVSRSMRMFAEDERLILVTSQTSYTDPEGVTRTMPYTGTDLGSDDPVTRMAEMLRLHTETYLLLDPLYGVIRREALTRIPRRNMLREDEVLAIKLALAGPWGHVPEILSHRNVHHRRLPALVPHLGVPRWTARFATTLQYREILNWLPQAGLTPQEHRRARAVVLGMYMLRQRRIVARRGRKVLRLAIGRR